MKLSGEQFVENIRAIHHRHREIEDDQREVFAQLPIEIERLKTVLRGDHAVTLVREDALGEQGHEIFVIDDHQKLPRASRVVDFDIARDREEGGRGRTWGRCR